MAHEQVVPEPGHYGTRRKRDADPHTNYGSNWPPSATERDLRDQLAAAEAKIAAVEKLANEITYHDATLWVVRQLRAALDGTP